MSCLLGADLRGGWFQHTAEAALQAFRVLKPQHVSSLSLPLRLLEGALQRKANTTGSCPPNTPVILPDLSKVPRRAEPLHMQRLRLEVPERQLGTCPQPWCPEAQDTLSPELVLYVLN